MLFKSTSTILIILLALNITHSINAETPIAAATFKDFDTIVQNALKMIQDKFEKTKKLTKKEIEILEIIISMLNKKIEEAERAEYWHLRQGR